MAQDNWYYLRGGQQVGPVPFASLQQAVAGGQVGPQDMVWQEGMGDWQPASNIPGLVGGGGGNAGASPVGAPYGAPPGAPYGAPPLGYAGGATGQDFSGKAIGSLVCGILSLLICGIILGPVAIVLSQQAKAGMAQSGNYKGKGMATAGMVLGIIGVAGWLVVIIIRLANM